ncbi:cation:proton antiporter [Myroides ceti]|uniref:Cation:proton antiporter n=1 Tax=Paenimyroides ceti TaxID=395087 RepID=A0ABT8CUC2_9FLAO|nr:cation:proton antiporter [Paenimyroides ceti]MDN3708109.1 cation:proton antiporter [Paenimyroides ceti]
MKKYKNTIFYTTIILVFSYIMYWAAVEGKQLEKDVVEATSDKTSWFEFIDSLQINLHHPLAILLLQIITIVIVARFFGWFFNKIGQPSVIGEIIAGIVLGPSLFGMYFPEASAALFPAASLGNLQFFSQIGLILFMFVIGMELDLKVLKSKAHDAIVISHASIIIPFALGMVLAYFIYDSFAPEGINFLSFSLFMGIAMSITAFPVLARIVQERGIHKTKLGTVVLTSAAADDITAWCILAVVIAIVKAGSFVSALYVVGMALVYVFLMMKLVRPFLKRIGQLNANKTTLSKPVVAIFLLVLVLSSYATEVIGIHALFGAFMTGAIMPDNNRFRHMFVEKVEDVAVVLFLPLFFVYTGLRTEIGLLNDIYLWKIAGLIILVAVTGKFIGSALAAKYVGQSWKDSLTIGALMNTRGLMELIALNIGFELGVLTPEVFAMMVIMALATTFMTGPAIDFINKVFKNDKGESVAEEIVNDSKYKILFSFGNPDRGKKMLKIANSLSKKQQDNSIVTALHLGSSDQIYAFDPDYEQKQFLPIVEESKMLHQKVSALYKVSIDIDSDIVEVANKGEYDLLLIGLGESIYEGTLLGKLLGYTTRFINPDVIVDKVMGKEKFFENSPFDDRTRHIIANSKLPLGIFIDKGMQAVDKIFIPFMRKEDVFLIEYIQKFIHNNDSQIVIMDFNGVIKKHSFIRESIRAIEQMKPNNISIIPEREIQKDFLEQKDLMMISLGSWKKIIDNRKEWIKYSPSILVMKP